MAYKKTTKKLKDIILSRSLLVDDSLMDTLNDLTDVQLAEPKSTEANRKLGWCACLLVERGFISKKEVTKLIRKDILARDD